MKTILRFHTGLWIAALFCVFSCLAVQSVHAEVSAMIMQSNGTTLQKASQHLLSGQQTTGGFLGQIDACGPCGISCSSGGRSFWVDYLGRRNSLDFTESANAGSVLANPFNLNSNGVQFGADLFRSNRTQFGVLFDYERFDTLYYGTVTLQSDNFSGGLYYAQVFDNKSDFRALAKFGGATHKMIGFTKKVDSDAINATFEYGKRLFPVQNVSWRPYVALDINYAYLGADSVAGMEWRNTKLMQTYVRIGTDLVVQIKRFTVKADISYSVDLVSGRLDVDNRSVQPPGTPWTAWDRDHLHIGRQIASVGLTGQYDFNRRNAVFASFGLDAFFDRDSRPYQSVVTAGFSTVW